MREPIKSLNIDNITSETFVIAPSQIRFISEVFSKNVANSLNMRTISSRLTDIAEESLRKALASARHQGEKQK